MTPDLLQSIREFCNIEVALKSEHDTYQKGCENAIATRNGSYASISRVMQDDGIEIMELASGGYLRKTMTKTQTTLKADLVEAAIRDAVEEMGHIVGATPETFLEILKKCIRSQRTTESPRISHIAQLPRALKGEDVPRANEYISDAASSWIASRKTIATSRGAHMDRKKQLEQERDVCLEKPGVREYMRDECGQGKPVRIEGHSDRFLLKYSDSSRRRPMRETHVQEAIEHGVLTLIKDISKPVPAADLAQLIMDIAREKAGSETVSTFSLSAKSGRKRAVDGSTK